MIDRATLARIEPELTNQWTGPALIEHARAAGGESCAWGVAFALRQERLRLAQLTTHFRKLTAAPTAGERLGLRVVHALRAARKAWADSRGLTWR